MSLKKIRLELARTPGLLVCSGPKSIVDPLATAVGDPQLKEQITGVLQSNPKVLGYFAMAVSAPGGRAVATDVAAASDRRPTEKAMAPATRCPSSEMTVHSTVLVPSGSPRAIGVETVCPRTAASPSA